jgi:hypothetical protein
MAQSLAHRFTPAAADETDRLTLTTDADGPLPTRTLNI